MSTICNGRGLWTVDADFPTPTLPRVRWSWDGSNWTEIEANDYTILQFRQEGIPGQWYDVYLDLAKNGLVCKREVYFSHWGVYAGYHQAPITFKDFPIYTETASRCSGDSLPGGPGPQTYTMCSTELMANGTRQGTMIYSAQDIPISNKIRLNKLVKNGQTFYPETYYTLKILKNNNLVFQETKNTPPSAYLIPEQCQYLENWQQVYQEINLIQPAYLMSQSLSGNKVKLRKCIGAINNNQITATCEDIKELEGSCNAPKLRGRVKPLCPAGTCEMECGGDICCYNNLGIPVRSYDGAFV